MYTSTLIENRITRLRTNVLICHFCDCTMKKTHLRQHLASDIHQEKLNQTNSRIRETATANFLLLARKREHISIVKNHIRFDENYIFMYCIPCQCHISGLQNTRQHMTDAAHQRNLNEFKKTYRKDVDEQVENLSSDKDTDKTAVEKSFAVQASSFSLQLMSNDIIYDEKNKTHYCNVCKTKIAVTPDISEHIQGSLHHANKLKLEVPISNSNYEGIIYDDKSNSYHCTICNLKIDITASVIEQHIQGFRHQVIIGAQKIMKIKNFTSQNQEVLVQTQTNTQKFPQAVQVDSKIQDDVVRQFLFTKICRCTACHTVIGNSTMLRCHVMLHLHEQSDSFLYSDLIRIQMEDRSGMLNVKCVLCQTNIIAAKKVSPHSEELERHLKSTQHLDRLALFNHNENDTQIAVMNLDNIDLTNVTYSPKRKIALELFCNVCNVPVTEIAKKSHKSGIHHKRKLWETTTSLDKTTDMTEFHSKSSLDYYACFICNFSFSKVSILLEHYQTHEHQWKMTSLYMFFDKCSYIIFSKGNVNTLECTQCQVIIHDVQSAVEHVLGPRHNEEFKFPLDNFKDLHNCNNGSLAGVADQFETLTLTSNHVPVFKMRNRRRVRDVNQLQASVLNSNTVDSTLNAQVPLDFSNEQIRRLPLRAEPKAPRTPKTEDQQKSFTANFVNHGKNYVKFSIDKGQENIYNFHSNKISLMQLGVNLTFPHNSDRVCIPCGQIFPDNVQSLLEHLQNQEHVKNLFDSMMNDKEFELVPEQFSDLRLAKLYMHVTDQAIQCNACNVEIDESDEAIRQHVEESVHEEKCKLWKEESEELFQQYSAIYKDIWYYAQVYSCEVCQKRYDIEINFVMHLLSPGHLKKVNHQLKFEGIALKFDLCPYCVTYFFGRTDTLENHYQSDFHKRFAKNKDFMVPNLTNTASEYLEDVDKNVVDLIRESDKANLQYEKEDALLKAIVEAVKPAYPNAQAYVFGSRLSDLGFPNSDFDVFVDCESTYYTSSSKEQSQQCMKSIENYFESTPDKWIVDDCVIATRIPILKLRHIPTHLKCDISVTNGLNIEKSKLLGLYNRVFPICRKLILFVKKWLTLCRVLCSDYIITFANSWCVVFYFQLQRILPTVHELMKRKKESKIVDGWECGFEENIEAKNSHLSFKEHLKGFFTYFANFDYQKNVICPYLGKAIDKRAFAYTYELPKEMDLYKKRLVKDEVEIFRFDSPMCIQDPIDLSQNLTNDVSKLHLRYFRQYCLVSAGKF